jgi:P4 family phage/plasmid primase-like protien
MSDAATPKKAPPTTPADVYRLFFRPGEVVEVRALGCQGKSAAWDGWAGGETGVFGYFDNAADLTRAVEALKTIPAERAPGGIYFTPNPPLSSLIARASNRLVAAGKKRSATHDKEIAEIRWLLVDLDIGKALRPAGISSTDDELRIAAQAARDLLAWLQGQMGMPEPIKGFSGNGYHLVWRIATQPPEDRVSGRDGLIHRCLQAMDARMREIEPRIDVDQKVYNASRIWKLYGTVARKGDHTTERPHRYSRILSAPAAVFDDLPKVSLETLEALAEKAPALAATTPPSKPAVPASGTTTRLDNELGPLDVRAYLDHYGVPVRDVQKKGDATWYRLERCLFDAGHTWPDCAVVQNDAGTIWYHCSHNSCSGYKWADARREISGNDKIARFCANYQAPPARGATDGEKGGRWEASRPAGKGILRAIEILPPRDRTPRFRPEGLPDPDAIHPQEFFDIKGKRERFVVRYAANYLAAWFAPLVWTAGVFYHYEGGVWREMEPMELHHVLIRAMKERVQANWLDESLRVLRGMVHLKEDEWPVYSNLINVKNGMIDMDVVATGDIDNAMISHDPKYGSRIQLPVRFDPDAKCPHWMRFLDDIFPEKDPRTGEPIYHKHTVLQQFCGYILLPTCKFEKCLFCFGTGANGKSTLLNAIEAVVGTENTVSLGISALLDKFNIPSLRGKLLNVASEIETREPAGTEVFKKCISGDLIEGEVKYGERQKFRNTAKFIFAMNNPPAISDRSHGFQRKVLVLNFNRRFEEAEMDRDLADKLIAEKEGIFLWSLVGAGMLVSAGGFQVPQDIEEDHHLFMSTVNPLMMWVDERCELGEGYQVLASDLFEDYCAWIDKGRQKALGRNNFYQTLQSNYDGVRRGRIRLEDGTFPNGFTGIRLKPIF